MYLKKRALERLTALSKIMFDTVKVRINKLMTFFVQLTQKVRKILSIRKMHCLTSVLLFYALESICSEKFTSGTKTPQNNLKTHASLLVK